MLGICEESCTVSMMSELGSAHKAKLQASKALTDQISRINTRLFSYQKATDNVQSRAKLKVLQDLNPEASKAKELKRNKRRRMIWNQKKSKPSSKKRIIETFDSVTPVREYKKKITIEERLEVVRWYDRMMKGEGDDEKKDEEEAEKENEEGAEQEESELQEHRAEKMKSKQKRKKGSCRRKGRNLLALARTKFPGIVGQHTALCRWSQSAKKQRWEDLPEKVRKEAKEVPDVWKAALGHGESKGKQRFQQVPNEVMKSLDEHMCLICQGVSAVTERCEEVLLHEIVQSSVIYAIFLCLRSFACGHIQCCFPFSSYAFRCCLDM